MKIGPDDLQQAVARGIISPEQADRLWALWESERSDHPRFDLPNLAYYFGALVVLSAMGWFMNNAWEQLGGLGLFSLAVVYGICFLGIGHIVWHKPGLRVPGGLLITLAVCMLPLAIYGLERYWGLWLQFDPGKYRDFYHLVKGGWFWMELGLAAGAMLALWVYRFPFLTAPLALALFFMSMDLVPLFLGPHYLWQDKRYFSLLFGSLMIVIAVAADTYRRQRYGNEDFSFWLYLFGAVAFWGGLTLLDSDSEIGKLIYCLINICLLLFSVLVQRRVFSVFGAIGVAGYIGHLAYRVFKDSLLFPVALTFAGLAVIFLGVLYSKHRQAVDRTILSWIPAKLRRLFPH